VEDVSIEPWDRKPEVPQDNQSYETSDRNVEALLLDMDFRFENAEDVAVSIVERRLEGAVTGRARVGSSSTRDRFIAIDVSEQGRIEGRVIEVNGALPFRGDCAIRGRDGGCAANDYLAAIFIRGNHTEVFVTCPPVANGAGEGNVAVERGIAGEVFVEAHQEIFFVVLGPGSDAEGGAAGEHEGRRGDN